MAVGARAPWGSEPVGMSAAVGATAEPPRFRLVSKKARPARSAPSAAPIPPLGPIRVRAAGCVVWRPGRTGPEVAGIHRPRSDDRSFPKGQLDPGESYLTAAVRGGDEETGYPAVVGRRLPPQGDDG